MLQSILSIHPSVHESVVSCLAMEDRANVAVALRVNIKQLNLQRVMQATICSSSQLTLECRLPIFRALNRLILPPRLDHLHSSLLPVLPFNDEELSKTLYLKYISEDVGWGVFARCTIQRGERLLPYLGEVLSTEEKNRRYRELYDPQNLNYVLTVKEQSLASSLVLSTHVDATTMGNLARFVNHACSCRAACSQRDRDLANTAIFMYREQDKHVPVPILESTRAIYCGEEIRFDYQSSDWTTEAEKGEEEGAQPVKRLRGRACLCYQDRRCHCCRRVLPSSDSVS